MTPYRALKALHLLGWAAFLGSVFGHIAASALPGAASDPQTILFVRRAIEATTRFVTLPGLGLVLTSGVLLTWLGRHGVGRKRWLSLHQAIGVLIALNAFLVLAPAGREALAAAEAAIASGGSFDLALAIAARESRFGPVNVLLALATVFIAVLKPRLGQP